jgi:hypothetical protein
MINKNLPNIPLYIGDWEKDCNVLSLETEAAWLRIIFKMFTNGKQSSYKLPTKGLQNLWRVSEEKASEILDELIDYNICEIQTDGRFTEFTCRRYVKENSISEIRKESVSKRKDRYKPFTKELQTTENEIENESKNENDFKNKKGRNEIFSIEILKDQQWVETVLMKNKIDLENLKKYIDFFNKKLISELDEKISKQDYASHFSRWLITEVLKSKSSNENGDLISKN